MNQLSSPRETRHLFLFVGAPVLVLLIVALVSVYASIPIRHFMGDPADLAQQHPLWGVLSNVGILLWCTCAAVCAFGSQTLARHEQRITERVRHLRGAAFLTLALLLDDFFMIHEDLASRYLGVSQTAVVALLGVATLVHLCRFGKVILAESWGLLMFALVCLLGSLLVDQFNDRGWLGTGSWTYFAEDGPKFMGIAAWCGYHYRLAMDSLESLSEVSRSARADDQRRPEPAAPQAGFRISPKQ